MKTPTGFRSSTPCTWSSGAWPVTSLFPPRQRKAFHEAILDEIREERVVSSRKRINPRGVKRKMSNYPLSARKRQRTRRIDFAKQIRIVKRTVLGLAIEHLLVVALIHRDDLVRAEAHGGIPSSGFGHPVVGFVS